LPQSNLTQWSYVLSGIKFDVPSGGALMFDVSLSSMTSTNGVINFTPLTNTQIYSVLFSIILINACQAQIEMQFVGNPFTIEAYNPTIFNTAGRTSHYENVTVNLQTPIANSTSNYIREAFLSSFHLTSLSGRFELWINPLSLSLGINTQTIRLYSDTFWQNRYSRICFTYILVNLLSLNYQPVHNTGRVLNPSNPITNNLGIPDAFYPYLTKKCIFGLT
jgi:hypothetical protein